MNATNPSKNVGQRLPQSLNENMAEIWVSNISQSQK